jgi:hypothetical protein
MRSLSASQLMDAWEGASGQHPVDRALTLLSACSGESRQELAALSIGRRDARLLDLYERLFGATLDAFAECPQCGEALEYGLSTHDLLTASPESGVPLLLETGDAVWRLRLPDSFDLRAASECSSVEQARKALLQKCVVERGLPEMPLDELPESMVERIASRLAEADPQAETLVDLTCCACRHAWQVLFDIEVFLWVKIGAMVRRLIREVDALARAYGWREHDILALSAVRRQAYLEMVGSWPIS